MRFSSLPAASLMALLAFSCIDPGQTVQKDYAALVNPFVGTGEHGHTYPGAVLPFGMVQLSPDTRMANWDGSSGYHYSDSTILGFSHTHLSGTGEPELCDILLMPTTGPVSLVSGAGTQGGKGYQSAFRHDWEKAEPGYYRVLLDSYNITAELTASERTGFHRYTFPASNGSNIIIDLKHRGRIVESSIELPNDSTVTGHTVTTGWADQKHVYFFARFSKPFARKGVALNDTLREGILRTEGKNVKAFVRFNTSKNEQILVKVGISSVSVEGARLNLEAENRGWDFDGMKKSAREKWNRWLSKIDIEGGTPEQQRVFYTALYHTALAPVIFTDADGSYFGHDHQVHKAEGFNNYSVFSLWDVFRSQMPLFTILEPSRMEEFLKSFMAMYRTGGRIPRFEIWGTLTDNMIGYHSLPVILDAWQKGIRGIDGEMALKAMKEVMKIPWFDNLGYIPADIEGTGGCVARTMEHAYNAWCVAEMARVLKRPDDQLLFEQRAQFYRNLFDPSTGFMRPRNQDHTWVAPFDPAEPSGFYVEGNAYQYSAFVPHDINSLIALQGGEERFVSWLDTLFTHKSRFDRNVVDASGLIGQYAHGNEPSHQIACLYNYAGAAPKTQFRVRQILQSLYSDSPGGISGNEDCGQMSAWYVMSALGIFPVVPGMSSYAIGSPLFGKATVHLENGKTFTILANHNTDTNCYIQSARLNRGNYTKSWISHDEIARGGELLFEMGSQPNYNWGTSRDERPSTRTMAQFTRTPWCRMAENYFFDRATIILGSDTEDAKIYYTTDGSVPSALSSRYKEPLKIDRTTEIRFIAAREGFLPSTVVTVRIEKQPMPEAFPYRDITGSKLSRGLTYRYFEEHVMHVDELDGLKPKKCGIVPFFSLETRDQDGLFAFTWDGLLHIPADGVYTFSLSSNDGGVLYLDGRRFLDEDGPHTATPISRTVLLKKGTCRIGEKYFQMGGAFSNQVMWKGPGIQKEVIPPEVLFHQEP